MRTQLSPASLTRSLACLAVLGALLLSTGCVYNNHRSFGATEKWVASDIHTVPKILGTPFIAIVDGIIGPATAACDQWGSDELYHPDHRYLSYAGSRVIGRSEMGHGYQWLASVPSIILDTVWLILTGPIDLVTVLCCGDETTEEVHARQVERDRAALELERAKEH